MSEPSSALERRRFTRLPFTTRAQLTLRSEEEGDRIAEVVLFDLCLQGALIEVLEPDALALAQKEKWANRIPACGERVTLTLFLDEDDTIISMETDVVHVQERQVGLRCRTLDLDSITHLRRLVELNLGDAALFQRELALLGHAIPSSLP